MYLILYYDCINIVIGSLEIVGNAKSVEFIYVPPGLIFHLVFDMCFSCHCDVIAIMVVVCIVILMRNQQLIVLNINKDLTLSSSLRHGNLNICRLFQGIMRKNIIITKPGGSRAARKGTGDAFQKCTSNTFFQSFTKIQVSVKTLIVKSTNFHHCGERTFF